MSNATSAPATPAVPVTQRTLRLPQATALIVGSIIGVGIFNLPARWPSYGPISLVAMALTTVGALALAYMFAALSRRLPADGGPYAYARAAFGNPPGSPTPGRTGSRPGPATRRSWSAGCSTCSSSSTGRTNKSARSSRCWSLDRPRGSRPRDQPQRREEHGLRYSCGPRSSSSSRWCSCRPSGCSTSTARTSRPWNLSGDSTVAAIGGAMALCLFSYLGVETASVAAAKVRDPDKNVPKCHDLRDARDRGGLPAVADRGVRHRLRGGAGRVHAPFSTAVNDMFGGTWAGYVMAALRDHLRVRRAQRLDDDLRRDAAGRSEGRAVPGGVRSALGPRRAAFGIIASTALASIAMVFAYCGPGGLHVFNTLVFMSGITAAIPYGFSALAQIKWRSRTTGRCTRHGSPAT